MTEQDLGYGHAQVDNAWVISPDGRRVQIVRGNITLIPTKDIGIKLNREAADFIVKISNDNDEMCVYLKGCEVGSIVTYDKKTKISGEVWVV